MAKDDKQNGAPQTRVYKANAVHKRRAGKALPSHGEKAAPDAESQGVADEGDGAREPVPSGAAEPADRLDSEPGLPLAPEPEGSHDARGNGAEVAHSADGGADDGSAESATAPDGGAADGAAANAVADGSEVSKGPEESSAFPQEDDDAGREASEKHAHRKTDPKTLAKRIALAVVAILVILAMAFCSYIAWNRWGRFDDAADIQGQWYVDGTATPIVIDGQTIQLSDDVAYSYEIDTQEKTIRFSFANWEGQGRYRFSDDRQRLLIIDGEYSSVGNLFDDLFMSFDDMAKTGSLVVAEVSAEQTSSSQSASSTEESSAAGQEAGSQEAASGEAAQQSESHTNATSETSQQNGDLTTSTNAASQQADASTGLGQGVTLFNRQADPEALKAKEAAEKAAREQAEREAKEAAEAEAAEEAGYYYYDDTDEYYYEDGESQEDGEYASGEDEETWVDEES